MQYAVIVSGGKQYKVSVGDIIEVDRLKVAEQKDVLFDTVLLHRTDSDIMVGTPKLADVVVKGKVLENGKGEKIYVSSFKAKVRHRKRIGFRSLLSKVQIVQVGKDQLSVKKTEEASGEAEKPKRGRKKAS